MILQKLVDAAVGNVAKLQYTEMQCDVWWSLDWGKQGLTPRCIAIQVLICQQSVKEKIPGCTDTNKSQQSVKEKILGHT